uniref:Ig-like domain-containing protein n=1 Tax=Sinocyclocheilus rhinocerous TaxID=307959 RepID=A0A673K417_9TELE
RFSQPLAIYSLHIIFTVNCCHFTEIPKPKVIIKPDQHVFRGETVTLRCDIDGEGVTSWQYSWYKDGSANAFSELQEHTFSPVTESDAGKYSCYGAEREGSCISNMSDAVTLTVSAKVSIKPAQHVFRGDTVTIRCDIDGEGVTSWQYSWYKDGSNSVFTHATNDFILTDIPKPTLTVRPQSALFTGDSVTLRCEVDQSWDGWEFLWSKNSNTESTEASTKTIDSVKVSDGGEYRCRARREGHYTNYSEPVTVTIYGKYFSHIINCVMVFILYKLYVLLPYTNPTPKPTPYRKLCAFLQKNSLCMIYKRFEKWGHGVMSS